jgi:pyrophosphatase PpaX
MGMKIKAIIFDLDGTLADTIPLTIYSMKETANRLSGKVYSDEEVIRALGPIDSEIIKNLVDEDRKEVCVDEYFRHFEEHFASFVKPIDGITELLDYIKSKGIRTGLFTGRSLRGTKIVLRQLGIESYFDVLLPGDDTTNPKPDPEGIWKVTERLQVQNCETVYVGDFDVDILASKSAGVGSVLALWSSTGASHLVDLKPDWYFNTPYQFIEWLQEVDGEM